MKKGKVLITGVAGFIGANLAKRLLAEGYEVIGLDNLMQGMEGNVPQGVEFHNVDIRTREIKPLFNGIDVVFHLAAKNSLSDCQKDPVGTMEINVVGTAQVFEAAADAGVRKVIYAESSVLEEGEERRKGFYAISKATDAMLADGFRAARGLTLTGLRYFNVYGPGQDYRRSAPPIMSDLAIKLLRGDKPWLYEGSENNKRDFIYVDDVNDFHLLAMTDDRADNRMFRLGSGENHSMIEVFEALKKVTGSNADIEFRPRASDDPAVATRADISDAAALGWKPKTTLEEGLGALVTYIKKELDDGKIPRV